MNVRNHPLAALLVWTVSVGVVLTSATAESEKEKRSPHGGDTAPGTPVLWKQPVRIESRDLFNGPGGPKHAPEGTFTFVKEDLDGTNPKFVVQNQDGKKWKVKLGVEARPETAASRVVWAVGYFTNDDYFVKDLHVTGMPRLHRGQAMVGPDGSVHDVRLKAEDEKKVGSWHWRQDPFKGSRELNGLRVMMALINNWDLKDENNSIYREGEELVYMVSDLGASFGTTGRSWTKQVSKGDLNTYRRSKFIDKVNGTTVNFQTPSRPNLIYFFSLKEFFTRVRLEWIGRNIPIDDARWMGHLVARLSPKQLRDAFRAAGYSDQEADQFAQVMEQRIAQLTRL